MSSIVKGIITVLVVGIMGFAFWVMMYQPKINEIKALDMQIAEQKQKYEEYKVEAENLARWEQAAAEFQKILQQLNQANTRGIKDFIPSFLTDIERLAKEERAATNDPSFQVTSITPGAVTQEVPAPPGSPAPKKEEGKTPPPVAQSGKSVVQLNFTGRFTTIVDFLEQLGNFKLNKLVTIQRITLSPQASKARLSPTLTVAMPFEVYMLGGAR